MAGRTLLLDSTNMFTTLFSRCKCSDETEDHVTCLLLKQSWIVCVFLVLTIDLVLTTAELESATWHFGFSAIFALSFSECFSKYSACASLWRCEIKLLEFLPDNAVPHFSSVLGSRTWDTNLSVSVQYLKNSHTGLSFFRPASKVDRLLIFEKICLLRSSFSNQSLVAQCCSQVT